MDIETLQKLKDAGFPQQGDGRTIVRPSGTYYVPTLSELIEACGAGYFHLSRRDEIWQAEHPHKTLRLLVEAKGLSPEEALANLYIYSKNQ